MFRLAPGLILMFVPSLQAEEPRRDRFGDPLPAGAIARLGTVHAHPNVSTIRFTADGRTVVTTGTNVVRHWDPESGRVRRVITQPFDPDVPWQVISADGRVAAKAFADRIEIYDVEHDKRLYLVPVPRLKELNQGGADLTLFGIAPLGDLVFLRIRDADDVMVIRDGKIESWTGLPLGTGAPFFSDDGKHVAVWAQHEGKMAVAVRRCAPGAEPQKVEFPGYFMAMAPDGSTFVGHTNGKVFVAKPDRPADDWIFVRAGDWQAASFSRDGRLIAIATDHEVGMWEMPTKRLLWKSPLAAKALAFSPDGTRLAGIDHQLRVWDVKTGKALTPDFGPPARYVPSTPVPNRFVVTASGPPNRLQVWDWATGAVRCTTEPDFNPELAWTSADGARLHAFSNYRLATWDIATQKLLRRSAPPATVFDSEIASPPRPTLDGKFLHTLHVKAGDTETHSEGMLVRWDVVAAKVTERRPIKLPEFRHADLTPDAWGVYSSVDPENCEVPGRITDARTGLPRLAPTWNPTPQSRRLGPPVVSLNGRAVAFQLYNSDVDPLIHETVVLASATGKPLLHAPAPSRRIHGGIIYADVPKALSPDGRWLAVAHDSGIEFWDLVEQKNVPFHAPHLTPDSREGLSRSKMIAFVSNEHLIVHYVDSTILVWELPAAARRPLAVRLGPATWTELGDEDPHVALRAVWAVKNEPKAGLDLLRRVKPAAVADEKVIAALYADLASKNFAARDTATKRLRDLSYAAGPFLAKAQPTNAEQKRRTHQLLEIIRGGGPVSADERRAAHAVHAAELIGDAAKGLLAAWAKGDPAAILTREAKAALVRHP